MTYANAAYNFARMRTTLDSAGELLAEARRATGVRENSTLIELDLRKLIEEAARQRLAVLGGRIREVRTPRRRRQPRTRA